MTEDDAATIRAIGRVLANLPGAGAQSELIARGAAGELVRVVQSWALSPFPPPPEPVASPSDHTAPVCSLCGGSGVVTTSRTTYNPATNAHHKIGERTGPCPMGCNPDNVSRILTDSQTLMDNASRAVGLTPAKRDDDNPGEPSTS